MVLDQAVMNVAISQLVEDFDTTVTTIQLVIALYALVMVLVVASHWPARRLSTRRFEQLQVGSDPPLTETATV